MDISRYEFIDMLALSYDRVKLARYIDKDILNYVVVDDFSILFHAQLKKHSSQHNLYILEDISSQTDLLMPGIEFILLHYLVLNENLNIICNLKTIDKTIKFWRAIEKRNQIEINIFDAQEDKISNKLEIKDHVILPKHYDTVEICYDLSLRQKFPNRFFILMTKNEKKSKNYIWMEKMKFGIDLFCIWRYNEELCPPYEDRQGKLTTKEGLSRHYILKAFGTKKFSED